MISNDSIDQAFSPSTDGSVLPWENPSASVLDANVTRLLVAALPEETVQLVVRETYLFRAGQVIFDAMTKAKVRQGKATAIRPPFLAFRGARAKEAFIASLTSAKKELSLYEKAIKHNAETMKCLRKLAEPAIEKWLRENDADYYAGFAAESLSTDWRGNVGRLESELAQFVAAIDAALESLVGTPSDTGGVSAGSRAAMILAARIGETLAHEIAATNAIADERDRHVEGTPFECSFPRLPGFDLASSLEEATQLPVSFLRQHFAQILGRCAELRAVTLPALVRQAQRAEAQHTAFKQKYLLAVWQGLREFALANYGTDEELPEAAEVSAEILQMSAVA